MASNSKANSKSKTVDRTKTNEQMLLIRDDASQLLMIVKSGKVSSINKVSKLTQGVTVTWQNQGRERWRGRILHIGEFQNE
jgi:hypothetical protein